MMPTLAPPSVLSAPQRRCQILLTLFQPGLTATTATFSELNGVDDDIASLDISETGQEILRYHQLTLTAGYDGSYRVEGTVLNQRLCLFCCLKFMPFKIMMLEALFFNDGDKMAAASKRERHLS